MRVPVAAALLAFCAPFAAQADDVVSSKGVARGKSVSTVHQLAEDHMILFNTNEYTEFAMDTAEHPFEGMQGTCFGAVEIRVPAASGAGNCAFTDADGDMFVNHWMVNGMSEEGALTGMWAMVAGTGKFAGSSGGGTFHSMTDREAGSFENHLDGAMRMR